MISSRDDALATILFEHSCPSGSLRPAALRSRAGVARRAPIADNTVDHKPVPDEQHGQCADGGADKTRALIEPIPADCLANKGGHDRASDPEHSCENKARWLIRSRRHLARDEAGDESD